MIGEMRLSSGILLLIQLPFWAQAAPRAAPSFDCNEAVSKVEKFICRNSGLVQIAPLDGTLAGIYADLFAQVSSHEKTSLKKNQDAWLRTREKCLSEVPPHLTRVGKDSFALECLADAYDSRIIELIGKLHPGLYAPANDTDFILYADTGYGFEFRFPRALKLQGKDGYYPDSGAGMGLKGLGTPLLAAAFSLEGISDTVPPFDYLAYLGFQVGVRPGKNFQEACAWDPDSMKDACYPDGPATAKYGGNEFHRCPGFDIHGATVSEGCSYQIFNNGRCFTIQRFITRPKGNRAEYGLSRETDLRLRKMEEAQYKASEKVLTSFRFIP